MFALRGFDAVRRNLSNDRFQYWLQWSKLGTANCIQQGIAKNPAVFGT